MKLRFCDGFLKRDFWVEIPMGSPPGCVQVEWIKRHLKTEMEKQHRRRLTYLCVGNRSTGDLLEDSSEVTPVPSSETALLDPIDETSLQTPSTETLLRGCRSTETSLQTPSTETFLRGCRSTETLRDPLVLLTERRFDFVSRAYTIRPQTRATLVAWGM